MGKLVVSAVVVLFAVGCSGGSSGSSSSTGGNGTTGSTGSSGGTVYSLSVTGPYAVSQSSPAVAYTVSGGSNTQLDVNWSVPNGDVVHLTGALPNVSAIAVHTYQPADFGSCGIGVNEASGASLVNNTDPTCTVDITALAANNEGEQNVHGTLTATWTATNTFTDGGSVSGTESINGSF